MRKRIFLSLLIALLIAAAVLVIAAISKHAEVEVVDTIRNFYVARLSERNAFEASYTMEKYVSLDFSRTLSRDMQMGEELIFCGDNLPSKVIVGEAAAFLGKASAKVQMEVFGEIISADVTLDRGKGRWNITDIKCLK